jgi:hypothetical protein
MPHSPYSFELAFSDFYLFPTAKEKFKRIQLADEDQFLSDSKRFWGVSILKNWIPYFRLRWAEFKK